METRKHYTQPYYFPTEYDYDIQEIKIAQDYVVPTNAEFVNAPPASISTINDQRFLELERTVFSLNQKLSIIGDNLTKVFDAIADLKHPEQKIKVDVNGYVKGQMDDQQRLNISSLQESFYNINPNKILYGNISSSVNRNKLLDDVRDFHTKFGFRETWTPTYDNLCVRGEMMEEEVTEFFDAIHDKNLVKTIDALADLIYFALGTADLLGINFDEHWNAVQSANMEKVRGVKDSRPNSGGFDCIKPQGWIPPEERHEEILKEFPLPFYKSFH